MAGGLHYKEVIKQRAIQVLKNAVKYVDNFNYEDICCAYSALGEAYQSNKKEEEAIKTWYKQLKAFQPVFSSQTGENRRVRVSQDELVKVQNIFKQYINSILPSIKLVSNRQCISGKTSFSCI